MYDKESSLDETKDVEIKIRDINYGSNERAN